MTAYTELTDNLIAGTLHTMTAGDSLFIKEGVVAGSTDSDAIVAGWSSNFEIYGALTTLGSSAAAITTTGGSENVHIGEHGSVSGTLAISIAESSNDIINEGSIFGRTGGISIALGGESTIFNTGQISTTGGAAVHLTSGNNNVVNQGTINAHGAAIEFNSAAVDSANSITNSGSITGTTIAISGGGAQLSVVNTGAISGAILFGNESDSYYGELGTISGSILGFGGDDAITCGAGKNGLVGGAGNDLLDGGAGRDFFIYTGVSDSGGTAHDTIVGFDARKDKFDLPFNTSVTGIDASVATGQLRSDHFATDVKAAVGVAQLAAHHAVLFTPTTGDLAGHTFLVVDANGNAGFQTGDKDYVFDLTDADNLGSLNTADFI